MSISSIMPDSQSLLVQQLQAQTRQDSADRTTQQKADLETALKAAGADPSKLADIEQQIQAAIEKARQSSDGSTDPRAAVKDAVDSVLKQNGLDPAKFEAQMKTQHAEGHHRRHRGGLNQLGSALQVQQPQPVLNTLTDTTTDGSSLNLIA